MSIKKSAFTFVLITTALCSLAAKADDIMNIKFTAPVGPPEDIIQESSTLKLQQEQTIQHVNPPAHVFISVFAGMSQPSNNATISTQGHDTAYNFSNVLPLITAQVNDYILESKLGRWGWAASVGYSYSQYDGVQKTALHLLPLEAMAVYRAEFNSAQKFVPYAMAGPTLMNYFQRGTDQYNTSGSNVLATASLGVALNLNRCGLVNSRNDAEVTLQYQRNINVSSQAQDWSGNVLELGGTIAL